MIAEGIQKLIDLAKVEVHEVGLRKFASRAVHEIEPKRIEPLTVHSLQAVVDFFGGSKTVNLDVSPDDVVIHVVDPYTVTVLSGIADETYRKREHYLTAKRVFSEFEFGRWFKQDEMTIKLMTQFEETETQNKIIKAISGLKVSADATLSDDGVSQELTVRKGASRVETIEIKNPIKLKPVRTFLEVEQVEAPYVLRVKGLDNVPAVAIFEAGDQWKNTAITRIKAWLANEIGGVKILG